MSRNNFGVVSMIVAILGIAAVAWAGDGSCTPTYPQCPMDIREGDPCGNGQYTYRDVTGPVNGFLYSCSSHSSQCSPSGATCNQRTKFQITFYSFRCGEGPLQFCVRGIPTNPVPLNLNCSDIKCDPNGPDDIIPELIPPCDTCPQKPLPDPVSAQE